MSVPSISLVIPVHNGGENFRKCLASLEQFVPQDTEIIVVVDGGTDDSWQLSQTFARAFGAKVLHYPTASGPARARTLGARAARFSSTNRF
jgi:glycosyltransferase involved in cell wall biosynthesis